MPAAHLLSNHYNETRSEYYRQLDMASRSGGDVIPFIRYAMQGFVDGLRDQINVVRDQQIDVAWINFVHGAFHGAHGLTTDRRRDLVLQMSAPAHRANFLAIDQIPLLNPHLAKLYASKTSKTLRRDLNELVRMGLVRVDSDGRSRWPSRSCPRSCPHGVRRRCRSPRSAKDSVRSSREPAQMPDRLHQKPDQGRRCRDSGHTRAW